MAHVEDDASHRGTHHLSNAQRGVSIQENHQGVFLESLGISPLILHQFRYQKHKHGAVQRDEQQRSEKKLELHGDCPKTTPSDHLIRLPGTINDDP
jgi:hypothetical protein